MLANLTCNPGIIYDLFINNLKANVGHKFNTRDEVMAEIGRILGPGCDISVELNDPFGKTDEEILEEACIGMASGLSTTGKIPVFCSIAPFVTAHSFEMFRNDLGYMRQNAKIVGRNCEITYSDLGPTHHSLEDFALIRMIPGVVILAPSDPAEIEEAVAAMINYKGPVYMRIGNPKIEEIFERETFVIGKGRKITEGKDITVVTTGSTCPYAMEAIKELQEEGYSVDHDYADNGPYDELLAYYKLDKKGIKDTILSIITKS